MCNISMLSGHCYMEVDSIFAHTKSKSDTFNICTPQEHAIVGNVNKTL